MHPLKHFALSTAAALALSRKRDRFPWWFWGAGFLADFDHALWYTRTTGDLNPLAAWRYFTDHPQVSPSSELLFHRYGLIAGLWLAGRRWPALGEVAAGLAFHRAVDDATDIVNEIQYRRQRAQWQRLKQIVFAREKGVCQGCGASGVPLELHHRIPEHLGGPNHPDNLLALCHSCHDRAHGRAANDRDGGGKEVEEQKEAGSANLM